MQKQCKQTCSRRQAEVRLRMGDGEAHDGAGRGRGSSRKVKVVMSDYLVRWIVSKCSEEEMKGRFDAAAIALVQAGAISTRAHPRLIPYAIETGNLLLLEAILRCVHDLSEEDIVKSLKLVLVCIKKSSMDAYVTAVRPICSPCLTSSSSHILARISCSCPIASPRFPPLL
eukprot:347291-Hanusia_phi.AAC.3